MEQNAEQSKEKTNEVTLSEVQPPNSVEESNVANDPMGTIVSSPEAPVTIDSEINPDVDVSKKQKEQDVSTSQTPDPLVKQLQLEANELQKRDANESLSPQRQNFNISPERSDMASPTIKESNQGTADKMGVTGQISVSNMGESNNLGATGQSFNSIDKKAVSNRGPRGKAAGTRKPADNKSKSPARKGEKQGRSHTDIEQSFRKVINTAIIAKGISPTKTNRISSAISVIPSTQQDVERTKKYLQQSHPLKGQDPSQWKNIPPCISNAIAHIITSVIAGEESLFEWQMATNARLVKLQTQINTFKTEIPEFKDKVRAQIEDRGQKCDKLSKRLVHEITSQFDTFKHKQEDYNERNKNSVENNKNKLSKQHAQIIELQSNLTKSIAQMDDKINPLIDAVPRISLELKSTMNENLTVWYMDEDGESRDKSLKQFMMDRFEDIESGSKKKIAPFQQRLAAVDEQLEERHISMNSQINQVKQKVQSLWDLNQKFEKTIINYEQRFDKLDREFDIKMVEHEEKFKQSDKMIRRNSSRLMSPQLSQTNLSNIENIQNDLNELKKEILPQKLKQLENDLETKIKENGNLVAAKLDKKIKDMKLQLRDAISKQEKELSKKIKEQGKTLVSQISQIEASTPAEVTVTAPPQESPEPVVEAIVTEPDIEEDEKEDEKDNDEYVKLLIKEQLDERLKIVNEKYDTKIGVINEELEKMALELKKLFDRIDSVEENTRQIEITGPLSMNTTLQGTIQVDNLDKTPEKLRPASPAKAPARNSPQRLSAHGGAGMTEQEQAQLREELNDHNERISQLATNIKVLQLIVDDLPRKRPEDDPNHPAYSNLKNDLSSNYNQSPRMSRSLKRDKRATSSIDGRNHLKKNLHSQQSNESTNVKIVKQHESQYMKYAGIGNTKNAILNTAYKGQKTVQSHVLHATVSTPTADNRVHASMPSVDYSQPSYQAAHNTLTLFSFPEQEKPDGITRIPQINTIEGPLSTRHKPMHQQSGADGFMTARMSQNSRHYNQFRNSMAADAGLPQLTANLSKKNQKSKQPPAKKQAWGPGGTKFEKIQGF